jgi:hypothetical protein
VSQEQQTDEFGSVAVRVEGIDPDDKELVISSIEQDVERFGDFMTRRAGAHPLVRPEKAILKTYLLYKHQGAF